MSNSLNLNFVFAATVRSEFRGRRGPLLSCISNVFIDILWRPVKSFHRTSYYLKSLQNHGRRKVREKHEKDKDEEDT